MQKKAFDLIMKRLIRQGSLHLVDHAGRITSYVGEDQKPVVKARFNSPLIMTKLLMHPDMALGEGYMNGEISIEEGTIYDFLYLLASNLQQQSTSFAKRIHFFAWLQQGFLKIAHKISPKAAKENVAHHYDLSPKLYDLFLDKDRQYSCAFFHAHHEDLELAQLDKKRHLASKLRLEDGMRVLDIGCGWGGLALYLAKVADVNVVGLTLSEEQYKIANERAAKVGLSHRVKFLLQDYREIDSQFDRIVSVGMFEHVGIRHYPDFFKQIKRLLVPQGVALLHSIGVAYEPGMTSRWINKYIFPGGYIPALSEVIPFIEKEHIRISDIELLHHHYAKTLKSWRDRFLANIDKLPEELDDRFIRMWEYYLAGSEVSFRKLGLMNFQIQMTKDIEQIPLTRDYMLAEEDRLANLDYDITEF